SAVVVDGVDVTELRSATAALAAAQRALGLAGHLKGSLPGAEDNRDRFLHCGFSRRESDIVAMLLSGHRVPTIAESLFVSQSTVRSQLSAAFRKIGVSSQQELIDRLRTTPPI